MDEPEDYFHESSNMFQPVFSFNSDDKPAKIQITNKKHNVTKKMFKAIKSERLKIEREQKIELTLGKKSTINLSSFLGKNLNKEDLLTNTKNSVGFSSRKNAEITSTIQLPKLCSPECGFFEFSKQPINLLETSKLTNFNEKIVRLNETSSVINKTALSPLERRIMFREQLKETVSQNRKKTVNPTVFDSSNFPKKLFSNVESLKSRENILSENDSSNLSTEIMSVSNDISDSINSNNSSNNEEDRCSSTNYMPFTSSRMFEHEDSITLFDGKNKESFDPDDQYMRKSDANMDDDNNSDTFNPYTDESANIDQPNISDCLSKPILKTNDDSDFEDLAALCTGPFKFQPKTFDKFRSSLVSEEESSSVSSIPSLSYIQTGKIDDPNLKSQDEKWNIKNYLEEEAELSGSDIGSEDEDDGSSQNNDDIELIAGLDDIVKLPNEDVIRNQVQRVYIDKRKIDDQIAITEIKDKFNIQSDDEDNEDEEDELNQDGVVNGNNFNKKRKTIFRWNNNKLHDTSTISDTSDEAESVDSNVAISFSSNNLVKSVISSPVKIIDSLPKKCSIWDSFKTKSASKTSNFIAQTHIRPFISEESNDSSRDRVPQSFYKPTENKEDKSHSDKQQPNNTYNLNSNTSSLLSRILQQKSSK